MAINSKSRTSKSSLSKKSRFAFSWWHAVVLILVIVVIGIVILRFSKASGSVGLMLVDGAYTRHDNGSYTATPDGVAWSTSVNDVGVGHWQWYGPFETLQVWPDNVDKSVQACWTLRDNRPFGIEAEYVLDATANNGTLTLATRNVSGQAGSFKTGANSLTIQCLDVPLRNGRYDYGQVEYRLSMRKGSVNIFSMSRTLNGAVFSNIPLPISKPEYIWPLMPGVGSVRLHTDPQGGGCWNDIRNGHGHSGVDIVAPLNSTVIASKGGTVQYSSYDAAGYGNYIVLNNGNGWYTLYGHLNRRDVSAGQQVGQGQQIGLSGNTGNAAGTIAHLHFQLQNTPNVGAGVGSGTINPLSVLPKDTGRDYGGCN